MICFYHKADLDGRCSGAIVKKRFPSCQLYGIDYGEPFPWEMVGPDTEVVMVDFSLQPFSQMVELSHKVNGRIAWLDHHKSAIAEHEASKETLFMSAVLDTERAACEICWQYYFADELMPEAVYLLGRYDIWKHEEVPGALEFQYGMRLVAETDTDAPIWNKLLASPGRDTYDSLNAAFLVGSIKKDGDVCLKYERVQNAAFCRAYAFEVEFDGLRCIAANRGMSNSLLFESVYDPAKHDAMLMFAWKGGQWTLSLYSTRPDVDVSAICKARGGGGHKGAAGFQCDTLPFLTNEGGR